MMLKVRAPKIGIFGASKEAENKSGIVEGYLFNGNSHAKAVFISGAEELRRSSSFCFFLFSLCHVSFPPFFPVPSFGGTL